jgi:hypothetical protein
VGRKRSGGEDVDEGDGDRPGKRSKGLDPSSSSPDKEKARGGGGRGGKKPGRGGKKKPGVRGGGDPASPPIWLDDGTPPKLEDGARTIYRRLVSLHTEQGMTSLSTLLSDLVSGGPSDVDLGIYDLNFASILSQCSKVASAKSVRDFHVAILYIRLAVHID